MFGSKQLGSLLPSELLSEDGTKILEPVIAGRGAKRTCGPALFMLLFTRARCLPQSTPLPPRMLRVSAPHPLGASLKVMKFVRFLLGAKAPMVPLGFRAPLA